MFAFNFETFNLRTRPFFFPAVTEQGNNIMSNSSVDVNKKSDISEYKNSINVTNAAYEEQLFYNSIQRYALQKSIRLLFPNSKLSNCCYELAPVMHYSMSRKNGIPIGRKTYSAPQLSVAQQVNKSDSKPFYVGFKKCNNPWVCPICSHRIAQKKSIEVSSIVKGHSKREMPIYMLTLTVPHKYDDKLTQILSNFQPSFRSFVAQRNVRYSELLSNNIGYIRNLETTFGFNGFHVHSHILFFNTHELSIEQEREKLFIEWKKIVEKKGFESPVKEAFHLKKIEFSETSIAEFVAEYVNKSYQQNYSGDKVLTLDQFIERSRKNQLKKENWNIHSEITKQHLKKGKTTNLTPFDLLRSYFFNNDKQAAKIFIEYAKAFSCPFREASRNRNGKKCKGLSPLTYSRSKPTLREVYELSKFGTLIEEDEEKSDEEILIEIPKILLNLTKKEIGHLLQSENRGRFLEFINLLGVDSAKRNILNF
jgi:hypothetical protein